MSRGHFSCFLSWMVIAWPAAPVLAEAGADFADSDQARTDTVNEGELVLLAAPPAGRAHHHHTEMILTRQSLADGWAALRQCHEHIDPVASAELVYNDGRIRGLRVLSRQHIGRVWVDGITVQLRDVQPDARLCLAAESRVVEPRSNGEYVVRNGPFMRRFLDGYYPMRVTLAVHLPEGVGLVRSEPPAQPGFRVWQQQRTVQVDAWFEGRLVTRIYLQSIP